MAAEPIVLEFRGQVIPVDGVVHIGRNRACQIVITDDAKVSRTHARLTTTTDGTMIEDVGSANGVYLNGARLAGPAMLTPGDVIRVGNQCFAVMNPAEAKRRMAETCQDLPQPFLEPRISYADLEQPTEPFGIYPQQVQWLQIEESIAKHDWASAGKALHEQFKRASTMLELTGRFNRSTQELLCRHAIDMALASRESVWIESLIELHISAKRPLPSAAAINLGQIIRAVNNFDRSLFETYLRTLRAVQPNLPLADRQVCAILEHTFQVVR